MIIETLLFVYVCLSSGDLFIFFGKSFLFVLVKAFTAGIKCRWCLLGRDLRLQIPDVSPATVAGIFRGGCFNCCFCSAGGWLFLVGLGGLGVTCSPRDPRFVSSDPAEVDGFFRT